MTYSKEVTNNSHNIPHIISEVIAQGNVMSEKERIFRLQNYKEELQRGWIDKELIPYLDKINSFSFLITTQSCYGHHENNNGRRAHIDFRSMLTESDTINKIIRPFCIKRNPPDVGVEIMVEPYGIRYIIWMRNDRWQEQLNDFIDTLQKVNADLKSK